MFTLYERKQLKAFLETCDHIAACRFMTDYSKQSHRIHVGRLPDGRVLDEYPRYDDDDFRSFLTHYRKLRLEREPTHLFCIMKLLKRKGDPTDRDSLDYFRKEIKEEGRSWWGAVLPDQNGGRSLLSQEGLEGLILNGAVFHSDPAKRDALKAVIGNASIPKAVAFLNYLRFARTVIGYARETADLIRRRGYLAE
jgi:hypothetical protein